MPPTVKYSDLDLVGIFFFSDFVATVRLGGFLFLCKGVQYCNLKTH